ncbi:hypothetical protein A5745_06920 [Mycobacterium sp. IS-2888]|uniref:DUF732 domain-containing protein n=1 Tax=Mycobacterium sp. IS-2888 TaxID=1834159 RepID=UPI00096CA868|nr:DUF732 domain-containing protein [Mycobacterium sp. IS-2888]OMC49405.1 hypothetical protein A5745_06920 [Mycobacterium sp. IS-2888]
MRDRETIDSELRLLAAARRSIREQGHQPSSREADQLLDELLAHDAGASLATPVEPDIVADTRPRGYNNGTTPHRRNDVLRRRLGLFAALPLSLIAVAAAVVVIFASHHEDSSAQAPETPPSAAPPKPVAPKAPPPRIDVVDMAFIAALKQEGVPVPSQEYAMTQGHAVCDFLAHQPDFGQAVSFVQRSSIWDANQSAVFATGAIVSYCPQYQLASPVDTQPGLQNALPDLQRIQGELQGIQGDLRGIRDGLPDIPGHP